MQKAAEVLPRKFAVRHLAIWHRDELVGRLRAGEGIEGMTYNAATDSGNYAFKEETTQNAESNDRMAEIYKAIAAQQLKHSFNYNESGISASVTPGQRPDAPAKDAKESTTATSGSGKLVVPIIYRGDFAAPPKPETFSSAVAMARGFTQEVAEKVRRYRDPAVVCIVLHETAEVGLMVSIIGSADRRWLCDGTANYAAWRVTRDLVAPDFAQQVYNLDAQLRQHAAQQPKIDLVRWSAVEKQGEEERRTPLDNAHYAFATRAMFLLAERHGDDALAALWQEVAKTAYQKTNARTFAKAYRKRYNADLTALVKAAEKTPLPPPPAPKS
jgi:hypothetical protein